MFYNKLSCLPFGGSVCWRCGGFNGAFGVRRSGFLWCRFYGGSFSVLYRVLLALPWCCAFGGLPAGALVLFWFVLVLAGDCLALCE